MTSRKDGKKHPLFLLHLLYYKISRKMFKLTSLFKIRLSFEAYRPLHKAVQCWNCQGFFHLAQDCFLPPQCVCCGINHGSWECLTKNDTSNEENLLYCNCNGKHPSNYKGCENYPLKPRFKKSYARRYKR